MPEGDSVYRASARLHAALAEQTVVASDLRVPREATRDLRGETIHGVDCYGKHILMRIGDATLHSHLRMDGEWHVYPSGARWRKPAFRARAVIRTPACDAVGFDVADITVVPTRDEHLLIGHLGPDPLKDDAELGIAAQRLRDDGRSIHGALLDQRNIAGLGTIFTAEILFLAGIAPQRPAQDADTEKLVSLARRTLRASIEGGHRIFTGNPRAPYWVYGRADAPCRRCGTRIESTHLGSEPTRERIAFWCPRCQL